jgi:hypothetical protein
MKKALLTRKHQIKFSPKEFAKIKWLAREYADGNISRWIRYAAQAAPRRYLKKKPA